MGDFYFVIDRGGACFPTRILLLPGVFSANEFEYTLGMQGFKVREALQEFSGPLKTLDVPGD
jgi:hypothetical protein